MLPCREGSSHCFEPFSLDFDSSVLLQSLLGGLKKHRVAEVMKVLQSWGNGWATSRRYHEHLQLPRSFGCHRQSDDLNHYLQCPHLLALRSFLTPGESDPLVRWALISPCSESFLQIACVHTGCHAVRRVLKGSGIDIEHKHLSSASMRYAWAVFAEAYTAEARDLDACTLEFSVPSFSNFLATGSRQNCLSECLFNGPFGIGVLPPAPEMQPNR